MSWHPTYSEHPAVAYAASVVRNLQERTGRSMDDWVTLARREAPKGERACKAWLRANHSLGTTTASAIASVAHGDGGTWVSPERYLSQAPILVDAAYSGKRGHLRAIHDAVIRAAMEVSDAIRYCPTRTGVSLYRNKVIASLKPTTLSRVDLGLCLRASDVPDHARLIDTGGLAKGDRITRRIPLADADDVDGFVSEWLARAYSEDA